MTTRADLNRLTAAQQSLVRLAQQDIRLVFESMNLADPDTVKAAMLEVVPQLVAQYGELAAVAAAEWYEEVNPNRYLARLGDPAPVEAVQGSIRAFAGDLYTDDQVKFLSRLDGSVQRHVAYSTRSTVARNVSVDPSRPRYGRVPRGATTCAWCALLASRGFVYWSERSAGINASDYHDKCDCQIVATWDSEQAHIEGYDPDQLYDLYLQAREASGEVTDAGIAAAMREMFPDQFTDGHVH